MLGETCVLWRICPFGDVVRLNAADLSRGWQDMTVWVMLAWFWVERRAAVSGLLVDAAAVGIAMSARNQPFTTKELQKVAASATALSVRGAAMLLVISKALRSLGSPDRAKLSPVCSLNCTHSIVDPLLCL